MALRRRLGVEFDLHLVRDAFMVHERQKRVVYERRLRGTSTRVSSKKLASDPGEGRPALAYRSRRDRHYLIILSTTIPHFLRLGNILNILEQLSILGFMSIGMTFVMVSGGIDLSAYTIVSAASVVGATAMVSGYSPPLGCALMVVVVSSLDRLTASPLPSEEWSRSS